VQQESMRAVGREVTNRARQPDPRGIKRINDSEWIVNSTAGSLQVRKIKNDYRLPRHLSPWRFAQSLMRGSSSLPIAASPLTTPWPDRSPHACPGQAASSDPAD
jgi:hypothetical protein